MVTKRRISHHSRQLTMCYLYYECIQGLFLEFDKCHVCTSLCAVCITSVYKGCSLGLVNVTCAVHNVLFVLRAFTRVVLGV